MTNEGERKPTIFSGPREEVTEPMDEVYPQILIRLHAFAVTNKHMVPIGKQRIAPGKDQAIIFYNCTPNEVLSNLTGQSADEMKKKIVKLIESLAENAHEAREEYREEIRREM
jgi:hypothetical protein